MSTRAFAVAVVVVALSSLTATGGRMNLSLTAAKPFPNHVAENSFEPEASAPAREAGRKVYPVDEAAKDPSFKAFRDALVDAVKRKDTQFVLNSIAPDIQNDFGGGNGVENFKATWKLARVSESKLWAELDTILSMGGSFRVEEGKRSFWAPYVYSAWPEDFDCGEQARCYAVTAENVNVRREPSSTAPIVASLSYDIVRSKGEEPAAAKTAEGWTRITTPSGAVGYVATKFIRSPDGYRAGFARVKEKWLMTALVAGD